MLSASAYVADIKRFHVMLGYLSKDHEVPDRFTSYLCREGFMYERT